MRLNNSNGMRLSTLFVIVFVLLALIPLTVAAVISMRSPNGECDTTAKSVAHTRDVELVLFEDYSTQLNVHLSLTFESGMVITQRWAYLELHEQWVLGDDEAIGVPVDSYSCNQLHMQVTNEIGEILNRGMAEYNNLGDEVVTWLHGLQLWGK